MDSKNETNLDFDEAWYLESNQDVARAIALGRGSSGFEHYLAHGREEGRRPLPPSDWRSERSIDAILSESLEASAYRNDNQTKDSVFGEGLRKHYGEFFLNPSELAETIIAPRRVALVGSCMFGSYGYHISNPSGALVDFFLVQNAGEMPTALAGSGSATDYDLCIIQLPLRGIFGDARFMELDSASLEAHQHAFDEACQVLAFQLDCRMIWNKQRGLLTFVSNFLTPQRNPNGHLFLKYDLRNPEYFVSKLNEFLESKVRAYRNAYVLDIDRISASLGRRFLQDDCLLQFSHGAMLEVNEERTARIEAIAPVGTYFDIRPRQLFIEAIWAEIIAMLRVVRQTDSVKLIVVDLDDTLWNGVSGDISDPGPHMLEGWPLGLLEALSYLKKRGILLAIISKNEESRIRELWPKIVGQKLSLSNFAAVSINWRPKIENMQDLIIQMNLLPQNIVFIDDNPAEREAMTRAFPAMRILGRHPYYLRSTLLWSSETQVPSVTEESSARTEMMQGQLQRETVRTQLSREEFLRSAAPRVEVFVLTDSLSPRFERAFELLNKTNQFNTTGRRWTQEEILTYFKAGGLFYAFEVEDAFTAYGLVGVVLTSGAEIVQWVMSCRVLGYDIEKAVMAKLVAVMRRNAQDVIVGRLIQTDKNFPCRSLYSDCGFVQGRDAWTLLPEHYIETPAHIEIEERAQAENASK